jgi:hypothetical protein
LAPLFTKKGTGIGDNSVSQNSSLFATTIETEYSLTEAPLFAFIRKRVYVQLENVPDCDVARQTLLLVICTINTGPDKKSRYADIGPLHQADAN